MLLNGLALALIKDPLPEAIEVNEVPVDEAYRVPTQVLNYLRDSAQALEVIVYFKYLDHPVCLLDSYVKIVEQARKERAA